MHDQLVLLPEVAAAIDADGVCRERVRSRSVGHRLGEVRETSSNEVLARRVEPHLTQVGFQVENGEKTDGPVLVPVLFGLGGKTEKYFHVDAFHEDEGFVVEVEAGRAVVNNQFLKDLFQACMMHEVYYVAIAVRNIHKGENDFEKVARFLDILYASDRLKLPLNGILLLGWI